MKEMEKMVTKDDSTVSGLDKEARKVAIECCSQYLVQGLSEESPDQKFCRCARRSRQQKKEWQCMK